ncbi:hypothetical protein SDC9_29867 [bioreactor metagenome]|uniref:Uncharacterized protein n=1 Tax=bioreactor metagenome TaxID=1076179 RepID=A0A644UXU3_9ZZZZ
MPAMHHPHRQPGKALHRAQVILGVRVIGLFDQRAVIDDVARDQHAARRFPQRDAARGMARRVDHLELPVAQIDDVAIGQDPRRRRRLHRVGGGLIGLGRQRVEDLVRHIARRHRVLARRLGEDLGLGGMAQPAGEFVGAADVVEMGVACDGIERPLGHQRHPFTQRHHAHAAVDQHVAVAPAHVPDVAAIELLDEGLVDLGDVVAGAADAVPVGGGNASHAASVSGRTIGLRP